jgi:hypothetical protein
VIVIVGIISGIPVIDGVVMAAFNLQVFGTTKAGKPEVMGVLSKIIRKFDVIALQEIRDSPQTSLPKLRDKVTKIGGSYTGQYLKKVLNL